VLHLDLKAPERRRLERQLGSALTVRIYRRTLALLEIAQGRAVTDVARMLRVSRVAVYQWLALYSESRDPAALVDRHRGGRPTFWTDGTEAILQDALEHPPDALGYLAVNWTTRLLKEHVEERSGRAVSEATVRRQVRRLEYVWKRPRHTLQDCKSPRVRRRLRLIRKKVRDLPAGCAKLFEDETDLLLFPPLRAGWFPRGQPAAVPVSGQNAKRTVYGTIDVETGRRLFVSRGGACAVDFQALLRLIRQRYKKAKVALLLDQASRHTAEESRDLAADLAVELIWLPSRCINVNPMDRLWHWGKEKICANRQHASIDDQAELFVRYLQGLSAAEALRKGGIRSAKFWLFR
jgi:transposase